MTDFAHFPRPGENDPYEWGFMTRIIIKRWSLQKVREEAFQCLVVPLAFHKQRKIFSHDNILRGIDISTKKWKSLLSHFLVFYCPKSISQFCRRKFRKCIILTGGKLFSDFRFHFLDFHRFLRLSFQPQPPQPKSLLLSLTANNQKTPSK